MHAWFVLARVRARCLTRASALSSLARVSARACRIQIVGNACEHTQMSVQLCARLRMHFGESACACVRVP
eukprot:6203682-Pleurochrysis_carterae.AAC.6